MPIYRVIRKADKQTVYAYSSDQACEFPEYPFTDFDHIAEVNINPDGSINAENTGTRITKLSFRNRFATSEKAALEIAALDNPQADMQARGMAATLRAYLEDVQAATFIDLSRTDTRAGVMMLEQVGLINVGRALQILDTPPTVDEMYSGQ
jgi:hypothetical protein